MTFGAVAALGLLAAACGGTLEDDYRRNQGGTAPSTTSGDAHGPSGARVPSTIRA